MALHGLIECAIDHTTGDWRIHCKCGARFSSSSYGLAADAYRNHMAEGALPQRAEEGT